MSSVTTSIYVPAPPEQVWRVVMDSTRLGDWVTIHRRLEEYDEGAPRTGFQMSQRISVRGFEFKVHWELAECQPGRLAVWRGRGPARSRAHTEYRLLPEGEGTRFDYQNEFHAPLGPLGAAASRAFVGGVPEREANRSLVRLRALFSNPAA